VPPLVTVGVPVYNGAAYLADTIQSVAVQSWTDWELILLDDCSTDDSLAVAQRMRDNRIRVLQTERNGGLVAARNRLVAEARGEFIAWLDQDDLASPSRLAMQVAFLRSHPQVAVLGSWTTRMTQQPAGSLTFERVATPVGHAEIRCFTLVGNPLYCHTVMMRRSIFSEEGFTFREWTGNALDYDLWSRLADDHVLHTLPRTLGHYRVHAQQNSQGAGGRAISERAWEIQQETLARTLGLHPGGDPSHPHCRLAEHPGEVRDRAELAEREAWLRELDRSNDQRQAFPRPPLRRVLANRWALSLLGAHRAGIPSRALALRSPVTAWLPGEATALLMRRLRARLA